MRVLIAILLAGGLGGCALSAGYSVTKFEYREPPEGVASADVDRRSAPRPARRGEPARTDDGR